MTVRRPGCHEETQANKKLCKLLAVFTKSYPLNVSGHTDIVLNLFLWCLDDLGRISPIRFWSKEDKSF